MPEISIALLELSKTALDIDLIHPHWKISNFLHFLDGYQVRSYCMGFSSKIF